MQRTSYIRGHQRTGADPMEKACCGCGHTDTTVSVPGSPHRNPPKASLWPKPAVGAGRSQCSVYTLGNDGKRMTTKLSLTTTSMEFSILSL
jgi:hypothetical protein